ncbi:YlbL family protein [Allorhizocola rhizosphaerae]|uniref:YlbL family protein n=1 Tax=Allorhizocola rhizosphaerae TaxID=1872709 RepID=UPI000E3C550D|nr:PDZ domain-containing protein [Allorhizocola rhizosphaerae]
MRRRGLTVLLGALLTLLLGWQIGRADVPYVALSPGPTVDTLGAVNGSGDTCTDPATPAPSPPPSPEPACQLVIQITGAPTTESKGQLRMVTVSVQSGMTLLEAIRGWLSGEDAVVPRKLIYPENKTEQEVEQENKQEFENSQTSAETAALKFLGYQVQVAVSQVTAGGAAEGKLQTDDIIESVDGVAVTSPQSLLDMVRAKPAGTTLRIGYARGGAKSTVDLVSKAADDGSPRIGVGIKAVQPHPFELRIKLDKIGGPSAGMMFALGIIDKVKPEDMTHGKVIAGTGTIDDEGRVGAIGGVPQKLHGAKEAGATVFLVPAANCAEAKANVPDGLTLVKVGTLDEAVKALDALGTGGPLPSC